MTCTIVLFLRLDPQGMVKAPQVPEVIDYPQGLYESGRVPTAPDRGRLFGVEPLIALNVRPDDKP